MKIIIIFFFLRGVTLSEPAGNGSHRERDRNARGCNVACSKPVTEAMFAYRGYYRWLSDDATMFSGSCRK